MAKLKMSMIVVFILSLLFMVGCSSSWGSAGLGAAGGAAAAGGGYEYNANRETKRVEQDYKDGKIDQREHDIRIDQIKRMSILK